MLQIARATAFTISELLRENQLGGKITPPSRLGLIQSYLSNLRLQYVLLQHN